MCACARLYEGWEKENSRENERERVRRREREKERRRKRKRERSKLLPFSPLRAAPLKHRFWQGLYFATPVEKSRRDKREYV